MVDSLTAEGTELLTGFLEVCNEALEAHRSAFPYKQIGAIFQKVLGGRQAAVLLYRDDPNQIVGGCVVRFSGSHFEPVPEAESDPQYHLKLRRSYLEEVVTNREKYIEHPELLDWDWLKSRKTSGGTAKPAGQLRLRDIMTPEVVTIHLDDTVQSAASLMRKLDIGALPVVDAGGTVVGMLTDRDIAIRTCADGMDGCRTSVGQVMTAGIVSCPDEAMETDAAWIMENLRVRRLVAVDRFEHPVGIVSIGDFALRSSNLEMIGRLLEAVSSPEEPEF